MGKFCQILTELSARDMPIFLFLDNNLCKCQGSLTKLGMCIDIKAIWLSACDTIMAGYYILTFLLYIFLLILCQNARTSDVTV